MTFVSLHARSATLVGLALSLSAAAQADNMFVDFNGIDFRLQTAWNSYNASAAEDLTAAELTAIKSGIVSKLQTAFAGYNLNFTTTNPGGTFSRLVYNLNAGAGNYGLADAIDWRNQVKNDLARVYTSNFGDFLVGSHTRAQNLDYLTNSLARISAHEAGHNLGLQHFDPFGYSTNTVNGGYDIGTQQVPFIMSTFSGGLTDAVTRTMGSFNELEKIKLEFADGVAPTPGPTVAEAAGNNNTAANAQVVEGALLPLTQRYAVNIEGSITSSDVDFFKFTVNAGDRITANIFSDVNEADPVDTVITLYDDSNKILATNDDIAFSGTQLMANGTYSLDSLILNYEVSTTADYYVSVRGFNSGSTGDYSLLLTGAVPEPATLTILGLGALAALRRRKRA